MRPPDSPGPVRMSSCTTVTESSSEGAPTSSSVPSRASPRSGRCATTDGEHADRHRRSTDRAARPRPTAVPLAPRGMATDPGSRGPPTQRETGRPAQRKGSRHSTRSSPAHPVSIRASRICDRPRARRTPPQPRAIPPVPGPCSEPAEERVRNGALRPTPALLSPTGARPARSRPSQSLEPRGTAMGA